MNQAWIALGSNLGDRPALLTRAAELLDSRGLPPLRLSRLYETDPEGGRAEPPYLNAVLETRTALDPRAILSVLREVEAALGRGPKGRSGPRTCDLDLLSVGQLILQEPPDLILPHPRLHHRSFVLVPLCELDVHWRHPVLGETAGELLAKIPHQSGAVRLYGEIPYAGRGAEPSLAGTPRGKGR